MAQAVIVRAPEVVQQQQMTSQLQSLQLVQSLLGASIGSLAWIRGLFPDECFTTLRYLPEYARSYEAFSTAEPSQRRDPGAIKVTRLQKGKAAQSDRLLEYLEKGVFDALEKGYLKAMQLGIFTDQEKPDLVMEAYTFTFSYRGENSFAVQFTDGSGEQVTKHFGIGGSTPTAMVQQVTRTLVSTTQALHPLPDKRWLSIRLTYSDDTPLDYNPPGFRRLAFDAPGFSIPGDVVRSNCGVLDAGFHLVSVKVSNLDIDPEEPVGIGEGRVGRRLSTRFFEVNEDIDRYLDWETPLDYEDFDVDKTMESTSAAGTDVGQAQKTSAVQNHPAVAVIQDEYSQMDVDATTERIPETQPNEMVPDSFRIPEQISLSQEKGFLQKMMETPRALSREGPATQILPPMLSYAAQKRPAVDDTLQAVKIPRTAEGGQKLVLASAKAEELKKRKKSRRSKAKPGGRRKKKPNFSCECGHRSDDIGGEMIRCDGCNGWQHVVCYGFRDKDPRIPDSHYCYTCLLGSAEGELLEKMKNLAFFRRVLSYVWNVDKFPTTIDVFAAELRCNRDGALIALRRLVEEGFMVSNSKNQTKNSIQHLQHYTVVKNAETEQLIEVGYFSPSRFLEHHYPMSSDEIDVFQEIEAPPPQSQLLSNESSEPRMHDAIQYSLNKDTSLLGNENSQLQIRNIAPQTMHNNTQGSEVAEVCRVAEQVDPMYVGV
ncbi:HORMA domain-containing protein [Sphaerosporella brunnea]|uniref:HORMA domain-containing protein n=1 Tax=Sphaerosporella brunnea TaxID=1250544 RepID=A0A5J5F2E2_9PEZI|nr:HORMA domain-containing protein [Sphaerosporella brunnea]